MALCSLWVLRVSSNFLWWGTCVCASLWAQVEASIRVGMSSIDSLPCFVERGAHTELELFQQSVQPVSPLGLPIHTPSPPPCAQCSGYRRGLPCRPSEWGLRIQTQAPVLAQRSLYPARHAPSPGLFYISFKSCVCGIGLQP